MIRELDYTLVMASATSKVVLVSSFGPTSMVIIDRICKLGLNIPILTIDTGELFLETHNLRQRIEAKYGISIQVIKADSPTPQLWTTNTDMCCNERKVSPLKQALKGYDAWLTGLRHDQATTRADIKMTSWDDLNGLVKIAPLAEWTRAQVWAYLLENDVPYNSLHDAGYKSIGCTHCTRPLSGSEREGRWQGQVKTECGLHLA